MADPNAYLEGRTITRDVRFMLQRHHGEDWEIEGPTLTPLGVCMYLIVFESC